MGVEQRKMPKYCPECGSLMDDYSDFCRECGARSSTHHGKYKPWSAKKSINSQKNSKKVFTDTNNSFSRNPLSSDSAPQRKRGGVFRLLPTFIGLVSIILIFCLISSGMLNFDGHDNNKVVFANSTNTNSQVNNSNISQNSNENSTTTTNPTVNQTYLLIDYSGSWMGSVGATDNMRDYSGNNSKKIEFVNMAPEEVISASIQKQDANDELLVVKLVRNGVIIKEAQTTAPYGVATVTE